MPRVVICGAGIAGVSTAFHLARTGVTDVLLVDPRSPLTLTSDKSTECYRNWWPNRPMVELMNRSIALLEQYSAESGNAFGMNRRGYLYLTGEEAVLSAMAAGAEVAAQAGAGELRVHREAPSATGPDTWDNTAVSEGADLFIGGRKLRQHFPYITGEVAGGLFARNAGWLSAQQLGMWMLGEAERAGVVVVRAEVTAVGIDRDEIRSVQLDNGTSVATRIFVNAAGPMLPAVGALLGVDLPVFSELHAKAAFRDHLSALPRTAPMVIWNDTQRIDWSDEERAALAEAGRGDLLGSLPAGCHARPEGGEQSPWVLGLWEYGAKRIEPTWPLPLDSLYTEAVLRGLATMVPGLSAYRDRLPAASVDGGYYTKTVENRPLAGPVGPRGSYVCGALSGFGIMAACGVGELVAYAIGGRANPEWAKWFDLRRYEDADYMKSVRAMGSSGQL